MLKRCDVTVTPQKPMEFICNLGKALKNVKDVVQDNMKGMRSKLLDKFKNLADGAIESMGDFVDGVKIFGCPSRPLLADEICRSELPQNPCCP